jgi:hypothetical protein
MIEREFGRDDAGNLRDKRTTVLFFPPAPFVCCTRMRGERSGSPPSLIRPSYQCAPDWREDGDCGMRGSNRRASLNLNLMAQENLAAISIIQV